PYQDNLSALIHEPSFKQAAGEAVFSKARVINTLGNRACAQSRGAGVGSARGSARAVPRRLLVRPHVWSDGTTRAGAQDRSGAAAPARAGSEADGGAVASFGSAPAGV